MGEEPKLTERETEILEQLATGASNRQIARRLHISTNTVKVHLHNIYRKLDVESRTEATLVGLRTGRLEDVGSMSTERMDRWPRRMWVAGLVVGGLLVITVILAAVAIRARNQPVLGTIDLAQLVDARWEELAPMPTPRRGMAVVAYDGLIYAIAGSSQGGVTGVTERYDPETDTWESLAPKPTAVTDVGAAVVGGKIYIPGGRLGTGASTDTLEIFDPHSGEWEVGPPMPEALAKYAIATYEGGFYLFGGSGRAPRMSGVWKFEPQVGKWEPGIGMAQPRAGSGAATISQGILLAGGVDSGGEASEVQLYRPEMEGADNLVWSNRASLPILAKNLDGASFADIAYFCGATDLGGRSVIMEYVSQGDAWRSSAVPYQDDWTDQRVSRLGNFLYLVGGMTENGLTSRVLRYQAVYTVLFPNVQ